VADLTNNMTFEPSGLRPYQQRSTDQLRAAMASGKKRVLYIAETGQDLGFFQCRNASRRAWQSCLDHCPSS
jgi:hypothetical protein